MYHYTESGLSNVFLKNGFKIEIIDGVENTYIDYMCGLHRVIAEAVIYSKKSLTHQEFKFLRIELNVSQKMLGKRFGISEQTIARYEKNQTKIPRTTDATLRTLYMKSQEKNTPVCYFLDLLENNEAGESIKIIRLEAIEKQWKVSGS